MYCSNIILNISPCEGIEELILVDGAINCELPASIKKLRLNNVYVFQKIPDTVEECHFTNVENKCCNDMEFIPAGVKKLYYKNANVLKSKYAMNNNIYLSHCHELVDAELCHMTVADSYPASLVSLALECCNNNNRVIPPSVKLLSLKNIRSRVKFTNDSKLDLLTFYNTISISATKLPAGIKMIQILGVKKIPVLYARHVALLKN